MALTVLQNRRAQKIHITNEIIHNPGVNERLADMKIDFVPGALIYVPR